MSIPIGSKETKVRQKSNKKIKKASEDKNPIRNGEYLVHCFKDVHYLNSALWWSNTKEGPEYWRDVYNEGVLDEMAKSKLRAYMKMYEKQQQAAKENPIKSDPHAPVGSVISFKINV